MTEDDIPRLKKGVQLKEKIAKVDQEIETLQKGVQIRIISNTDGKHWVAIPIHPESKHEFTEEANHFVNRYIVFLERKKESIQKQFDEL